MTTKHQRYDASPKGKARDRKYYYSEKGLQTRLRKQYARRKKEIQMRIVTKELKLAELERILQNAKEI